MKLEKITFIIGISALLIACSNSPAPVQMRVSGGYIQYNAGYGWQDLIDVESLRGPQGLPGPQGPAGIDAIPGGAEPSAGAPTATPDPDGQDAAGSPDMEVCEHLYQCTAAAVRPCGGIFRRQPVAHGQHIRVREMRRGGNVFLQVQTAGNGGRSRLPGALARKPARPGIYRSPGDTACVDAHNTAHPAAYPASFPDAD